MDPWKNTSSQPESVTSQPTMNFEDNFAPKLVESPSNNEGLHLPDSAEYLARLEHKLDKLKKGKDTAKSLVESLSATRQACMIQLLSLEDSIPKEMEEEISISRTQELLLRHLTPEKQAISMDELVVLLKADQLARGLEEDEET